MDTKVKSRSAGIDAPATATLEHLTGPARGTASVLDGDSLNIFLDSARVLRVRPADDGVDTLELAARLHQSNVSYELEALENTPLWVNGERITSRRLDHRDLIEFGEDGPLCRFNLHRDGMRLRKTVSEIFNDCVDYARVSRRPWVERFSRLGTNLYTGLTRQTSLLFRLGMLGALTVLSISMIFQYRSSERIRQELINDGHRLEEFGSVLARTQREALRYGDLVELREEIDANLSSAQQRLSALESKTDASARVILASAPSVVFLQGAYGFREIESGRMLRHVVDASGRVQMTILSQPLLTLGGEGPVAERQFTGTAFVITNQGALLTNRHVALPWENDTRIKTMEERGMEPVMTRFIGYLPGMETPFDVRLARASDEADLAILTCEGVTAEIPRLELRDDGPRQGDEVIVMGYPTGLRSMVAQSGSDFIDSLKEDGGVDFWGVADRLAREDQIHPLASRGIVARLSESSIVYDAKTTHGGSGGPVLDTGGRVVAVNAAVLPDYTGSNLGVPVSFVRRLLAEIGIPYTP